MTPKEALDILRNRVSKLALNHKIGNRDIANLEVKDIVMSIETHVIPTFEQALTELEAIKRDVKRYFELDNKHGCTLREIDEWLNLERKLMKVGKKE